MAGFVECLDSEDTEEFVRVEEGMALINVLLLLYVHGIMRKTLKLLIF